MIARVAVKQKINSDIVFDYKIKKGQMVQPFSVVKIDFAGKKTLGIVLGFKSHSPKPCKEIQKNITDQPFVTKQQVELARAIADYFISPFGPTLLSFLPGLPQREMKKIKKSSSLSYNKKAASELVLSSSDQRLWYYLQRISTDKQNLIIFPLLTEIAKIAAKIKKARPDLQIFTWHSKLSAIQKRIVWQKCISGESVVIIGSRDGLFLPFRKLGCIFIDSPASFSYFEDQLPRYNGFFVARLLQKQFNASLFVGETFPGITSYIAYKKNVLALKEIGKRKNRFEIYDGFYNEIQNPTVINKLAGTLQKAKKIAIIWPFKENKKVFCSACRTQIKCAACQSEYFTADFKCSRCGQKSKLSCPKCKNQNLAMSGYDKSLIFNSFRSIGKENFSFFDLDEINSLPPIFDQALVPFFDNMANFPFVSYREKIANGIWAISEKTSGKIHIFTDRHKELATQISNFDWEYFIKKQLIERKKEGLPPYTKAIKMVSRYKKPKSQIIAEGLCKKFKTKPPIFLGEQKEKMIFLLFFDHLKYKQAEIELRQKVDGKLYFVVDPVDFGL